MKPGSLVLSLLIFLNASFPSFSSGKSLSALQAVEAHYKKAKTIQMNVAKTLKLKLLEKEKHSDGTLLVKRGGNLRWETLSPEHSLVVINKKAVWLVDYPAEDDQKIAILKATHPKKSQPHALVAFLIGEGNISSAFKVLHESKAEAGDVRIDLKPKEKNAQFRWLKLFIKEKENIIEKISFEDLVGNETELTFSDIQFNKKIDSGVFKFVPPKNADVTVID